VVQQGHPKVQIAVGIGDITSGVTISQLQLLHRLMNSSPLISPDTVAILPPVDIPAAIALEHDQPMPANKVEQQVNSPRSFLVAIQFSNVKIGFANETSTAIGANFDLLQFQILHSVPTNAFVSSMQLARMNISYQLNSSAPIESILTNHGNDQTKSPAVRGSLQIQQLSESPEVVISGGMEETSTLTSISTIKSILSLVSNELGPLLRQQDISTFQLSPRSKPPPQSKLVRAAIPHYLLGQLGFTFAFYPKASDKLKALPTRVEFRLAGLSFAFDQLQPPNSLFPALHSALVFSLGPTSLHFAKTSQVATAQFGEPQVKASLNASIEHIAVRRTSGDVR